MAAFNPLLFKTDGTLAQGTLQGDSPRAIRQQLRSMGLTPIEVPLTMLKLHHAVIFGIVCVCQLIYSELSSLTRQLATLPPQVYQLQKLCKVLPRIVIKQT